MPFSMKNGDSPDIVLTGVEMWIPAEVTQDAIIVIPGIMGSVLAEAATGRVLWGLAANWYVRGRRYRSYLESSKGHATM